MGEEINRRYSEPLWQKTVAKAANDLGDRMKDKMQADTFDTANFMEWTQVHIDRISPGFL